MSKYTDDVYAALGVVSPWELGEKYKCPVIFFETQHTHAFGTRDHRAEVLYYRDEKRYRSKPIRIRTGGVGRLKESRAAHLKAAVEWAERRGLGVAEWVPSGWPDAWVPKNVKGQLMTELKKWRKLQQASPSGRKDQ